MPKDTKRKISKLSVQLLWADRVLIGIIPVVLLKSAVCSMGYDGFCKAWNLGFHMLEKYGNDLQ